jgi:hypothetical protein
MAYYRRIRDMREDHDLTQPSCICRSRNTTATNKACATFPPLPSFSWLTFTKHRPIIF